MGWDGDVSIYVIIYVAIYDDMEIVFSVTYI